MTANEGQPIETLEAWLSAKPYWEQYVWQLNLEKEGLAEDDLTLCYQYLSEYLGLIASSGKKPPISLQVAPSATDESTVESAVAPRIAAVTGFERVNALPRTCAVPFGPNLTLIYGGNGAGKSGVARLLCDACFSRGERQILPDARQQLTAGIPAATFVMDDGSTIRHSLGERHAFLKRYSVFDSKSVLIHLDQSNRVNFTPSQIRIFDKVAATIAAMEDRLTSERRARRVDNPFPGMFVDGSTTPTALFCRGINGSTKAEDFLPHASFDPKVDGERIAELEQQIDARKKLDIPQKKAQLAADRAGLLALKASLNRVTEHLAPERSQQANQLIRDILEKTALVETLGAKAFDDGIIQLVGSAEWHALLVAAKALYEAESVARGGEPTHCLLCHQKLTDEARALFYRYWEFLQSKAEAELAELQGRRRRLISELTRLENTFPGFLNTDAGIKVLANYDGTYLAVLQAAYVELREILGKWIDSVNALQEIESEVLFPNLGRIDWVADEKEKEEQGLVDPASEILSLAAQLSALKDRKSVSAVKDAALEYIAYCHWSAKANINFAGIKAAITKKRTEWFLVGVASNYNGLFNGELRTLGCDFNLVMHTSGDQGNTVKEYRLDFADEYAPSQILSEGEQNACALADFLTEVQLDRSNSGIIFDDPVTSLDHQRKGRIASRLAHEASKRQVIIFTHDLVFASQLAKHAASAGIPLASHWMRRLDGEPGHVDENATPKLDTLAALKKDCAEKRKRLSGLSAKEQEDALGVAFDYLRSCCEALIEEVLFAGTIERHSDHVKVQNLEEMIADEELALRIVELHGRLSEFTPAHNRSSLQREHPISDSDFDRAWKEFEQLERDLREERKKAKAARQSRKEAKKAAHAGWG